MFINKLLYQFSATAAKNNIDNTPSEEILANIKELDAFLEIAYKSWEKYSDMHGIPRSKFMIVSAYRCPKLNKFVGGVENSPHTLGYAADVYVKNTAYWFQFCDWMAEFAKDCFEKGLKYEQIAPEGNGKYNWMHLSIKDFHGNQPMRSIEKPIKGNPFKAVTYGEVLSYASANPSVTAEHLQHILEGRNPSTEEIEGERRDISRHYQDEMPNSYTRVIYVMKRLMKIFAFKDFQAAAIVGNLLADTDGRLSTTLSMKGYAGICRWTIEDQLRYRKLFMNDTHLKDGNLMSQVSFLIHDISLYKIVNKILKTRNLNDACMVFFEKYEKYGEPFEKLDLEVRKDASKRRGYSISALNIYNEYKDKYKDEWNVGYFQGNGVNNDKAVELSDDPKIWNSHSKTVDVSELSQYAKMIADEADSLTEKTKDLIL